MTGRVATVAVLALLFLPGCGDHDPTGPAACTNLGGTWRVLMDDGCGSKLSDQVVIRQVGCTYQGATQFGPTAFEGTVSGKSVTIRVNFSGACPLTATGSGSINLDGVHGTFQGEMAGGPGCCAGVVTGGFTFLLPL